jgi:hypothetical protein
MKKDHAIIAAMILFVIGRVISVGIIIAILEYWARSHCGKQQTRFGYDRCPS